MKRGYKRLNQKGTSLVELLVALAIGSIVILAAFLLVQQSVKAYTKQTEMARIQNNANIAMNQICDNIMEADEVSIFNYTNGNVSFATKNNLVYLYDQSKSCIYLSDKFNPTEDEESLVCEEVKSFSVKISSFGIQKNSTINPELITGLNNPVQLRVYLTLNHGEITRSVHRKVCLRNMISDMTLMKVDTQTKVNLINSFENTLNDYIEY
jgi:prepilin-type N-terminal cleavage/methylation domain-containing protein